MTELEAELLAALKDLLMESWGAEPEINHVPSVARARAVIAKAEGQE